MSCERTARPYPDEENRVYLPTSPEADEPISRDQSVRSICAVRPFNGDRVMHCPMAEALSNSELTKTIRFERRDSERRRLDGVATVFCLSGACFGEMHELNTLDYSSGGLAAMSDRAIAPGTLLSIGFSTQGMLARRGIVRRCLPSGEGYRLSIEFEARLAA